MLLLGAIVAYSALLLWVSRTSFGTYEAEIVTDRQIGSFSLIVSFAATFISSVALVGFGGLAYHFGLQFFLFAAAVGIGCVLAPHLFLGPRLLRESKRLNAITIPELLGRRTDSDSLRTVLAAGSILLLVPYLVAIFKGMGHLIAEHSLIDYSPSVILIGSLISCYLLVGGFRAVLRTDKFQAIIIIVLLLIFLLRLCNEVGGVVQAFSALCKAEPRGESLRLASQGYCRLSIGDNEASQGFVAVVTFSCVLVLGAFGQPHFMHRFLAARDTHQLRTVGVGSAMLVVVLGLMIYASGALGNVLVGTGRYDLSQTDEIMPELLGIVLGESATTVAVVLVIAAGMSTIDSVAHTLAAIFVHDLLRKRWLKAHTDRHHVRRAAAIIALVAALIAIKPPALISTLTLFSWSALFVLVCPSILSLFDFGRPGPRTLVWLGITNVLTMIMWQQLLYRTPYEFALDRSRWTMALHVPPILVGLLPSIVAWPIVRRIQACAD